METTPFSMMDISVLLGLKGLFNGGALIVFCVVGLLLIVISIIELIGRWCLLQKMGRHDFAALVPFYDQWEYARGAGFKSGLSTLLIVAFVAYTISVSGYLNYFDYDSLASYTASGVLFSGAQPSAGLVASAFLHAGAYLFLVDIQTLNPWLIVALVALVIYAILYIIATYGVARSFKHGVVFTLGMLILPFIFIPILGCSKKQRYYGPHLNKALRNSNPELWQSAVHARLQAFGSNAPLVLSLIGVVSDFCFAPLVGIVLCVVALVRNTAEKGKPLSGAKRKATIVISILGLVGGVISCVLVYSLSTSFLSLAGLFS